MNCKVCFGVLQDVKLLAVISCLQRYLDEELNARVSHMHSVIRWVGGAFAKNKSALESKALGSELNLRRDALLLRLLPLLFADALHCSFL